MHVTELTVANNMHHCVFITGTPSIIWLPETILTYETPLNSTFHCNAKTELKGGTFIYDPPLNTVLEANERKKFTMHYIPADTKNYHEVCVLCVCMYMFECLCMFAVLSTPYRTHHNNKCV